MIDPQDKVLIALVLTIYLTQIATFLFVLYALGRKP